MDTLLTGNSFDRLKELPDNSVGALVTDPPYLINFMGNDWDKQSSPAADPEFWKLVLQKLKPGAHGLVFGHSRQHHRVMVALEDAGFEIRDCMMWMYGQGFPKNHNVGKAVDKLQGNKRTVVGTKADFSLDGAKRKAENHQTHQETDNAGHKPGYKKGWDTEVSVGSSTWEGWGTALKPAYEPIIMVRKPLGKKLTVAKNCLEHGVGAINIDDSRIGCTDKNKFPVGDYTTDTTVGKIRPTTRTTDPNPTGRYPANVILSHHEDCVKVGTVEETYNINKTDGASFFGQEKCPDYESVEQKVSQDVYECSDDCPIKTLNEQAPQVGSLFKATRKKDTSGGSGDSWTNSGKQAGEDNGLHDGLGGASRFFYCAKINKKERNWGCDGLPTRQSIGGGGTNHTKADAYGSVKAPAKNHHPTVKPVSLMYYLTKLIAPKGETVLDPFMGSGSTGMACVLNDNNFIGIDMDPDYVEISKHRINYVRFNKEKIKNGLS
jgi:DNA modification methylase